MLKSNKINHNQYAKYNSIDTENGEIVTSYEIDELLYNHQ